MPLHADMYQTLRGVLQDFLRLLSVVQKKHLPVAKRQPVQHEILMKVRNALIIVGLATVATTSFAASAYHASPVQEQGAVFTPDHLGNTVSRESVRNAVLVAQQDGSLQWISRGYIPPPIRS